MISGILTFFLVVILGYHITDNIVGIALCAVVMVVGTRVVLSRLVQAAQIAYKQRKAASEIPAPW